MRSLRSHPGLVALIALGVVAATTQLAAAYPRPGETERASLAHDGTQGNGESNHSSISADGRYVAFASQSSNLVPGDTNGWTDIFVHDRTIGAVQRVSVASDGTQGNRNSFNRPAISEDGRYVAFQSLATNLVPGDANNSAQIYLHDRTAGSTERVSVADDGTIGNNISSQPQVSADGRFVAFQSRASNLVPGDTNGSYDFFVHDRVDGTTERVSVANDGSQGNDTLTTALFDRPAMTPDGRYIAFSSAASNLVAGDTNGRRDVFVRDRVAGTTERVSISSDGTQGNLSSFEPAINADGRFVAFTSLASTLVPVDTNDEDIFVHDRVTRTTERVSVTNEGTQGTGNSLLPSISADGRFVAFSSSSYNLGPPGDSPNSQDIFVHDRHTRTTGLMSVAMDGGYGNGSQAVVPWISGDGRYVTFTTSHSNLVPGDTNNRSDVFVRDRGPAVGIGKVSSDLTEGRISVAGWATFSGEVISAADDPPNDGAPGAGPSGGELTGASLTYRPELEDLLVRLHVTSVPHPVTGIGPQIIYGLRLTSTETLYEVRVIWASKTADPLLVPHYMLYRCDPDCTEHRRLRASIGQTGNDILVAVPLAALGADEGEQLESLRAYTAVGEATPGPITELDEVQIPDATIPEKRVSLALAAAGIAEDEIEFDTAATLSEGAFWGDLDAPSSLSAGDYDVWARACFGEVCNAASTPVTLEAEISPSPTASPTAIPTEDPEPIATAVSFTSRSATAGQYSDETLFEARLTGSDGDPIGGAEVVFELTGEESSRTFTATTDTDGVAAVTPRLTERPGPHQLTVRFAGDDSHEGSADTTTFVVAKEDTELALEVQGKGNNRTLTARLSDHDSRDDGIAARTIVFYAEDELIGSATTDADGTATMKPPPRYRGGKHDFEARFAGDDYYLASSDRRQS